MNRWRPAWRVCRREGNRALPGVALEDLHDLLVSSCGRVTSRARQPIGVKLDSHAENIEYHKDCDDRVQLLPSGEDHEDQAEDDARGGNKIGNEVLAVCLECHRAMLAANFHRW